MTIIKRTPVREKAKYFLKDLKKEEPDYNYLRELFRHIRKELGIKVNNSTAKKLPYVPTEEEISKYYKVIWKSRKFAVTPLFNVKVPLLADPLVQQDKGTGLVMCCTFGDQTDIIWWKTHNLPLNTIITKKRYDRFPS